MVKIKKVNKVAEVGRSARLIAAQPVNCVRRLIRQFYDEPLLLFARFASFTALWLFFIAPLVHILAGLKD